jgi:hypothetical protein
MQTNDQPCSSSTASKRPHRASKPTIQQLVDGGNMFVQLKDAVEAATVDDTIAIIPPDGSDEEDFHDDVNEHNITEVAGLLEIVKPSDGDNVEVLMGSLMTWKGNKHLKPMESGPRLQNLSETHPILSTLAPPQIFGLYFTRELAEQIAEESIRYARQQGNMMFTVTHVDITKFVILLLYSSYVQLPRGDMYWQRDFDVNIDFPRTLMSRNRYWEIKRYLHFNDNHTINVENNRYAKIQPLFDHLNKVLLQFGILFR